MDVQTAAAGPALPLAFAVALGALALALAAVLAVTARRGPRRPAGGPEPVPPGVYPDDDLPAFRERPPGFPGAVASPALRRPPVVVVGEDRPPVRALALIALAALTLLTAAAAVAAASAADEADPSPTGSAERPPTVTARLAFGVVVLERRAVGVTVTSPAVSVTADGDGTAVAHVRLPTWNCLTPEPPADPEGAGCLSAGTEYADLPSPALEATRTDGGLRLRGRFPTYTRPDGTYPLHTGRAYALDLTVRPGRELPDGWRTAEGRLQLGSGVTEAVDGGLSVLRVGR